MQLCGIVKILVAKSQVNFLEAHLKNASVIDTILRACTFGIFPSRALSYGMKVPRGMQSAKDAGLEDMVWELRGHGSQRSRLRGVASRGLARGSYHLAC